MFKEIIGTQSVILTLDVDELLNQKLQLIADCGVQVVEINCCDPAILQQARKCYPMLRIGAGNVVNMAQLEACHKAQVDFVTSPGFVPALAQTAAIYAINYLPGVATLSEAMQAASLGYQSVRPYPADLSFCSLLNKNLPNLTLFPAEIEWENIEHFLNLPSVAAVSMLNPESKQLSELASGVLV